MRYGYFESNMTGYDEKGLPIFDRAEDDEFFTRLWRYLLKNGVMSEPGDNLMVSPQAGMVLKVNKGFGVIQGKFAYEDLPELVELEAASDLYPRIDAVVIRLDLTARIIYIAAKTGVPSQTPKMPELQREDDGVWEMCLATIRVEPGTTEIKSSNISDKRNDPTLCGLIQAIGNVNDKNVRIGTPTQKGSLSYTGQTQTPEWSGYDETIMDASGDMDGIEPGTYTALFRPKEGYAWSDGSTLQKEVEWSIQKISIQSPTLSAYNYGYDGNTHTVTVLNFDSTKMNKSGSESGKDPGSYSIVFTLKDSVHNKWSSTGLSTPLTVKWSIGIVVEIPYYEKDNLVFSGRMQIPVFANFDTENVDTTATPEYNVGNYVQVCSLKTPGTMLWEDGTTEDKEIPWSITKKKLVIPTLSINPEFTGIAVSPTFNNFDSEFMSVTDNSNINVGSYTAVVSLTMPNNTEWADGTTTAKTIDWEITPKTFNVPVDAGTNVYNGSSQTANLTGFDSTWMTKSGASYTEPGSYTCTVALNNKASTKWADGTTTDKSVTWTIGKAVATAPSLRNSSGTSATSTKYNGNELDILNSENQRIHFSYTSGAYTVSGTTKATGVGNYSTTFTLKDPNHYRIAGYSDTNSITKSWAITKGDGNIALYYNGSPLGNTSLDMDFQNTSSYEIEVRGNNGDTIQIDTNKGIMVSDYFACTANGNKITISKGTKQTSVSSKIQVRTVETDKYTVAYTDLYYRIVSW